MIWSTLFCADRLRFVAFLHRGPIAVAWIFIAISWCWVPSGTAQDSESRLGEAGGPVRVGGMVYPVERWLEAPSSTSTQVAPAEGVQAIFYEGVPYGGKPTRVFAYWGLPRADAPTKRDGKFPGVVLIHGGGGTAFANWVKLWNDRGFAAIAMDVCGCVPTGSYGNWQRHPEGGPAGWDASFEQIDGPMQDQWQLHAVSAVMLAHSWLRAVPEVDADRIGVTGISWGGYLTCIVTGLDSRFRCSVPVYGCGYLGENSVWLPSFAKLGQARAKKWLDQWDPSEYLGRTRTPMLWVNGTNDFAYPMDSWQRSVQLHAPSLMCLRIRMPHGHGAAGENPEEIHVYMKHHLLGEAPLPRFVEVLKEGRQASARFSSDVPIDRAELCFTRDTGVWQERRWESMAAKLGKTSVAAEIPADASVWYFNLVDERDCVVSSPHSVRSDAERP